MQAIHQNHEIESKVMGRQVEISVILPPDFDSAKESLPLLISLHGGGGDRSNLFDSTNVWESLWESGDIPP